MFKVWLTMFFTLLGLALFSDNIHPLEIVHSPIFYWAGEVSAVWFDYIILPLYAIKFIGKFFIASGNDQPGTDYQSSRIDSPYQERLSSFSEAHRPLVIEAVYLEKQPGPP